MTLAERLATLGTATLGEAAIGARLPIVQLRPVAHGMRVAGSARTVRCQPGDNLAIHLAIGTAKAGDAIVIDYGGSADSGPFIEIMALACQLHGVAGHVIDGTVRDSAQIAAMDFPVFSRGLDICGTKKTARGEVDTILEKAASGLAR